MALSSATNPVLDGLEVAVSSVTADDSDNVLNQIYPAQTSVDILGVTNGQDDYVTLPALADVPNGHEIIINSQVSPCLLHTPAGSGEKINNVDCDGTNDYPLTVSEVVKVVKISNTVGWMAHAYSALGAVVAAVVPAAVSASSSLSPSVSPSVSKSPSKSPSISPSISPSSSLSPSASPSVSPSVSLSPSTSPSVSPSVSTSPSVSVSPSVSKSPSISPSISPSVSPSVSTSPSLSPSASPSISPSFSPSPNP